MEINLASADPPGLSRAGFLDDPYPYYARYRAAAPAYLTRYGFWLVTRYSDVVAAAVDARFCSSLRHYRHYDEYVEIRGGASSAALRIESNWLSLLDPPRHTRMRRLIGQALHGQVARRGERLVEGVVAGLLETALARPEVDLIRQFAHPLSLLVMCHLLGVPEEDRPAFLAWAARRGEAIAPAATPGSATEENRTVEELAAYFRRLVKLRRSAPADDLVTALTLVADASSGLAEDDVVATCLHILSAGHLPMAGLIGNAFMALLRHPHELARLKANPALAANAVEELARYDGPTQMVPKVTREEVSVGGVAIPAGEMVMLCLAAANRDPARFAAPDELRTARRPAGHLAFGFGPHFCLGARLARIEARIALSRILERVDNVRPGAGKPRWQNSILLRGLRQLPVQISVARDA